MTQKIAWSLMTVLALFVAAYAAGALVAPSFRPPFVRNLFLNLPGAISLHLAGGLVAIVAGALQVNSRLRGRFLSLHRGLGRVYVVAVLVGGVAGFALALRSFGGLVTHVGFGMLAVCWIGSTLNAYRHIRRGDVTTHRAWMLRSYALTLAAVTLRLYLPLSQIAGIEFAEAYRAIAWMCWVPNLLVVEWWLLAKPQSAAVAAGSRLSEPS